jgi:crotonobetainyl-CoA:carnitine CoA-transferase CaiB-like acyl-CoA transferase
MSVSSASALLEGLRVVEFGHVLSGPYCAQILGDLGADVIKVERPGGEAMRANPPFYPNGTSHYFLANNRNKRSLVLDLATTEGAEIARELVARSDVVIENFRPGVMDRLGLGFDDLSRVNDRLVMLSISAFGQSGPWSPRRGYDLITQARGGVLAATGEVDGPPTKLGIPYADLGAGLWGAVGILAALFRRDTDTGPRHLDLSLLESVLGTLSYVGQAAMLSGQQTVPSGTAHPRFVPYGRYRVSDGYIILTLHLPGAWEKFCAAVGREGLAADPRFASNDARLENRDALDDELDRVLTARTRAEWDRVLAAADIAFGPVLGIGEALEQEQVVARGVRQSVQHPVEGEIDSIATPVRLAGETPAAPAPAPLLGEHTRDILINDLGRSPDAVEHLLASGVAVASAPLPEAQAAAPPTDRRRS